MDEETSGSFLSWQGAVTGPHTIKEIRSLLKFGKVHSLYKIEVDGGWILLRDHLAEIDRTSRPAAKMTAAPPHPASLPIPNVLPDEHEFSAPKIIPTGASSGTYLPSTGTQSSPANGIATASFILSLCFFIPVLNGITQLLALVFGHLALAQMGPHHFGKSRALASTGLWITYVQVGFLASSMTWLALTEFPHLSLGYLVMHGHMVGIALSALIGSGLLMLGIKLISDHFLSFRTCFIGTLLPAAVSTFGMIVIQSLLAGNSPTSGKMIATVALFQVFMFTVQMFFWAHFIKLPDDEELGFGSAALASLFYSVIFIFIGILYIMLFATLNPLNT
jgi:hypothetical protein